MIKFNESFKSLFFYFILILNYFLIFIYSIPYIPFYREFQYLIIIINFVFLALKYPIFFKKKYLLLFSLLSVFFAETIYTSYINRFFISDRNVFFTSIVFCVTIFELFFILSYISERNKIKSFIKIYYYLTLLFVLINDLIILISPSLYLTYEGQYFLGNKFFVSYYHLQLIVLFFLYLNGTTQKKIFIYLKFLFYFILTVVFTLIVNCNTGLIGTILLFILFIFRKKFLYFSYLKIMILSLLISILFPIFIFSILELDLTQSILIFLNRDSSLAGRTNIYEQIFLILKEYFYLGAGYGSAYEISMYTMGYSNTQNGLLNWVIQIGIFGTSILILIILYPFYIIKHQKNKQVSILIYPAVALLFTFNLLASVEITINTIYFFWIAFIFALITSNNNRLYKSC